MATLLYCIQCERFVAVHGQDDKFHTKIIPAYIDSNYGFMLDVDTCDGPFAFDAPSEMSFDVDNLVEPDINEMAMMDENALSLLADMMQ